MKTLYTIGQVLWLKGAKQIPIKILDILTLNDSIVYKFCGARDDHSKDPYYEKEDVLKEMVI